MSALRIALLTYRANPRSGGQGVYVRHLSRELAALGHRVEVLSGPPYPEVDDGVRLTKLPGLDLFAEPDPFRTPRPRELRDLPSWIEFLGMRRGGFPEPLAFSLRVARHLATTVTGREATRVKRWYGFADMQHRVARRLPTLTVAVRWSPRSVEPSRSRHGAGRRRAARRGRSRLRLAGAEPAFRRLVGGRVPRRRDQCVHYGHELHRLRRGRGPAPLSAARRPRVPGADVAGGGQGHRRRPRATAVVGRHRLAGRPRRPARHRVQQHPSRADPGDRPHGFAGSEPSTVAELGSPSSRGTDRRAGVVRRETTRDGLVLPDPGLGGDRFRRHRAVGRGMRAAELLACLARLRHEDGSYWTGYQFADDEFWPDERTTWTAGAVLLATAALDGDPATCDVFGEHRV
ncbi:hypothetical protein ATP06_0218245 [Amycolatopsis regifaucium]|uniref:Glycosyltransferase subfamily 4-like N-terminal domain-containing protein n=2 Tax=Amycolatopsis regifaucium TaxID=546365 RepID=A0ABX3DTK4_9PSEU|nr:hypothetical protein ATP06_0218245 [Amycolatopsis regifaucium]